MPRPVHFEITSSDPEKAIRFYQSALGWKFQKWDGPIEYWLIETGAEGEPGIDGGMSRRDDDEGTVNTVGVESLDATVAAIEAAGGTIVRPRMPVPGIGWLAYAQDPDGNPFGVMQSDESAA